MFNKIPTVPRSQELIDKAFSKASKIESIFPVRIKKMLNFNTVVSPGNVSGQAAYAYQISGAVESEI